VKPRYVPDRQKQFNAKITPIFQVWFEADRTNNNNTTVIKMALTNNGKNLSRNANPKIRNNGYATTLLAIF